MTSGITLATITRDSGEIPFLLEHDGSIFTCSSNGSMRLFNITHNLSKMQVVSLIAVFLPLVSGKLLEISGFI